MRSPSRAALAALAAASAVVLSALGAAAPPEPTPTPRLFDPRRPPARELATSIADGFTLAAVGDLIMERPLSQLLPGDPAFGVVVEIVRGASAAFGNFENVAIDLARTPAHAYPGRDDVSLVADPAVPRDLATLGFDIVSRANNHSMDWGVEGMRETTRLLDRAGLVHAGVGENRGEARAARYLETPQGRVGLVSMASTFSDWSDATPPRGPAPGRPGMSALRVTRSFVLPRDAYAKLRDVKAALDAPGKGCEVGSAAERESRAKADRESESGEKLTFLETEFRPGDRALRHYAMNPVDRDEILRAIRQGKQHSDLLIASIHAHETGLACEEPGDFLPELAHAAIDAGAGVFIAHGEHRLMPIEIYKGRPIFYSLANFFWCDILEPIPEETYEANRDLLARAYGDPGHAQATDQDLLATWNAQAFDDPRVFQSIVAVCRWEKGRVADVRLYPADLGYGERLTRSGTPRLASPAVGQEILARLQRISKPYGTRIDVEAGVGVIRVASP